MNFSVRLNDLINHTVTFASLKHYHITTCKSRMQGSCVTVISKLYETGNTSIMTQRSKWHIDPTIRFALIHFGV